PCHDEQNRHRDRCPGIHADDAIADRPLHLVMQYQARHTAWIALSGARAGRLRLLATRRYIAPASTSAMVYAVSLLVGRVRWRYESAHDVRNFTQQPWC
ncbi:hypothetical protein HMPREF9592_00679, partial [Cutibacterium acnes HL046PA1]|uniref:hypothetical protein n=1 Tax=Cutibacterium acnes TaxID=1747 RepID=UPI0001F0A141